MHRKLLLSVLLPLVVGLTLRGPESSTIAVIGGSAEQRQQVAQAVEAFERAGLKLPNLQISFALNPAECLEHMGLFETDHYPWRITFCSDAAFVYLHELAHAWELANLTDRERAAFMALRGHQTWADPDVPWEDRGVEGAAFIIQQGLMDMPLPPNLSEEQASRLAAFELLTGVPSPRLP
ncbi:MAG: hypothetical protein ACE5MI_02410 [Acidimicrobiia bacterium]